MYDTKKIAQKMQEAGYLITDRHLNTILSYDIDSAGNARIYHTSIIGNDRSRRYYSNQPEIIFILYALDIDFWTGDDPSKYGGTGGYITFRSKSLIEKLDFYK